MPMPACRRRSEVNELEGHRGDITDVEGFGWADGALDGQHVGAAAAAGKDRGRPRAAAEPDPYPQRTETTTGAAGQVTDLFGCVDRKADEGPAVAAPGIPRPQLGIENDDHADQHHTRVRRARQLPAAGQPR